jgi:hypothetical protein
MVPARARRVRANGFDMSHEIDSTVRLLVLRRGALDRLDIDEGTQLGEIDFNGHSDGTTTVLLTNHGLADVRSRDSLREGWDGSFDILARVVSR